MLSELSQIVHGSELLTLSANITAVPYAVGVYGV